MSFFSGLIKKAPVKHQFQDGVDVAMDYLTSVVAEVALGEKL